MDEQKIPSRSERHKKKKGGLFVKGVKDGLISQDETESSYEKKKTSSDAWYFTDVTVEEETEAEWENFGEEVVGEEAGHKACLLYTSPEPWFL